MSTRTTLVLLALLVLVAGGVYLIEFRKPAGGAPPPGSLGSGPVTGSPMLFDLSLGGINSFTVSDTLSKTQVTATQDMSGTWWLGQNPGDPATLNSLAASLARISIQRTLTPTGSLQEFGLVAPSMNVQIEAMSGRMSFSVGDATPSGSATYVQKPDDAHVYLIESGLVSQLRQFAAQPPVAAPPTPAPFALPSPAAP